MYAEFFLAERWHNVAMLFLSFFSLRSHLRQIGLVCWKCFHLIGTCDRFETNNSIVYEAGVAIVRIPCDLEIRNVTLGLGKYVKMKKAVNTLCYRSKMQ